MRQLISNKDIIKENFLKFYNDDTFYIIKIFSRKKDAIVNDSEDIFRNVFGSHNERLITNYYISSEEDFEKYYKVSEHIVNNIPYTRAYFNVNPKSKKKALLHLNDRVNQLVTNFINNDNADVGKKIQALSYSVLSRPEADQNRNLNWVILDVDVFEEKYKDNVGPNCVLMTDFENILKTNSIEYVDYPTLNGHHFIINRRDYGKYFANPKSIFHNDYKRFISNDFVDEKKDAAALLFYKNYSAGR
ncbi:hypothetical protein AADV15_000075 [Campylobacter coli]